MTDLQTQMHTYLEDTSLPVNVDELISELTDAGHIAQPLELAPIRRIRPRPVVVFLVASLVTLLVIGAFALTSLFGNGGPDVINVPPTVVTTVPTSTVTTATTETSAPNTTVATPPVTVVPVLGDEVNLADVTSLGPDVGEWTGFTEIDGLCSSNIARVEVDSLDRVWAIATCGGVSRLDGDEWVTIFETPATAGGPRSDYILSDVVPGGVYALWFVDIDASPAGPVWVALPQDVIVFDGEAWDVTEGPWAAPRVVDLAVDANGTPWALVDDRPILRGSEEGGLWRFDGKVWNPVAGSPQNGQALAVGPDGSIWVAGSNLARFDESGWTRYSWPGAQVGIYREQLLVDQHGTVWVIEFVGEGSTSTNVLWAFDDISWQRHDFGRLGGLALDELGDLWTAGRGGLFRFDGSTWSLFSYTLAVQPESGVSGVRDVAVGSDGAIWLAATNPNGVLRFKPPNP